MFILGLAFSFIFASAPKTLEETFLSTQGNCNALIDIQEKHLLVAYNKTSYPEKQYRGFYEITNLENQSQITFTSENHAPVLDLQIYQDSLFVLTRNGLIERSLKDYQVKGIYKTHPKIYFERKEHPTAMQLVGDKIYIAHGRLGMSVFDIATRSVNHIEIFTELKEGELSMATDLVYDGKQLFVLLDNYHIKEAPKDIPVFRGIVVYSPVDREVSKVVRLRDPGATGINLVGEDYLLISFHGFPNLVMYSKAALLNASTTVDEPIKALSRAWKYPDEKYGSHRGDFYLYGSKIYTCFLQSEDEKTFHYARRIFSLEDLNWKQ
tara:strand:- start:8040 stop:9008 length:969 start_codon:yes stop_codon:yes gene_type:complete